MSRRTSRENMRTTPLQVLGVRTDGVPETWREVVGFPGYFVSDRGRICGVDRIVFVKSNVRNDREILRRGQLLKPGILPDGHHYVLFGRGNHKLVHVAVLEAFVGPRPAGHDALHRDDVASNNDLLNLRWGTRSENLFDAIRNGKKPIGTQVYNSKLTEDAVRYIRANPQLSLHGLGLRFGVHAQAIKQVRDFTTWKHVA